MLGATDYAQTDTVPVKSAPSLSNELAHSSVTNADSVGNSASDRMKMRNGWKIQSVSNC